MLMYINIDYKACVGRDCLNCFDICPMNVFEIAQYYPIVDNIENCCRCGVCVDQCDYDAITIQY